MKTNINQNKKKFIQHINEMMLSPINEIKMSTIDAAIKKAKTYKDLSLINRLESYREYYLNKFREDNVQTAFVHLGTIPVTNTKAGRANSSRSVDVVYDFEIYKYLPYETVILCCMPKRQNNSCAAVIITEDGRIENIRDEKTQNDFLKEIGCKSLYDRSFNWMMNHIQPNSRDLDNNPVRPNRAIAKKFSDEIFKCTSVTDDNGNVINPGIRVHWRYFTQTREQATKREVRVDDYVYIGGFNITDNVKVRVCKHIGVAQPDYRIYPVYIKYFNYAFIVRFRYALRKIDVFGGGGYGTAYTMLVEKGYLENPPKDPSIQASTIQSSIVNIYQFMKDLQQNAYEVEDPNDDDKTVEVNLCDIILENISRIIKVNDQSKWNTKVAEHENITLDMIKKANNAFLSDLEKKRKENPDKEIKISDVENEYLETEAETEDKFGL